jgi:hypothetical protein
MSGISSEFADWSTPEPLDAREVFYVRHSENIKRWAALEKDVQAAALRFLTGLATEIGERGAIPGLDDVDAELDVRLGNEWAGVGLSRARWGPSGVSVRLEWHEKRVGLDVGSAPYVGVRLHGASFDDDDTRKRFREDLQSYRTSTSSGSTSRWPVWRRIPIDPSLVSSEDIDLSGYRAQLLGALLEEWEGVADIIDTIVASLATGPGATR